MSSEKTDPRQWFLRTAGNTIFGPVSTPNIILWAEQGRILPGHEISTDRHTWQAAESVPELGIAWYIDDGSGNLRGPLNRIAAETILKSDKAPAGACLIAADKADLSRVVRPHTDAQPPAAATVAKPPSRSTAEIEELQQRLMTLEAELAKQKEALTQARQAAKQAAALERERDALTVSLVEVKKHQETEHAALHEKLTAIERERDLAQQVSETRTHEREAAEKALLKARDRAEKAESAQKAAAAQIADLQAQASENVHVYNELMSFSNTRESELQSQIETLSKPRSPVALATDVCAADPGGALAHILGQEVDLLEKDLAQERAAMAHLRDWSTQRQEALQARIRELGRILTGGLEPGVARDNANHRIRTPDVTRLQAEMDTLRATHAQAMRTTEDRVTELTQEIRTLQNEEVRLRAQVSETDKLAQANQELTESIQRREQEVTQERKHREVERENFATTQQALLRRIEQLERGSNEKENRHEMSSATNAAHDTVSVQPQRSNLAPWFRLKR